MGDVATAGKKLKASCPYATTPHPGKLQFMADDSKYCLLPPERTGWDNIAKYFSTRRLKMKKNIGILLLGIWLAVTGLASLLQLSFSGMGTIMAILATVAGVLIIIGR